MINHIEPIKNLLARNNFPDAVEIRELPSSGSARIYFRIFFEQGNSVLAAFNADTAENNAWYVFSNHFRKNGFRVPEVFAKDKKGQYFLLQDLGSKDLFSLASKSVDEDVLNIYKTVLSDLLQFQLKGIEGLDMSVAYPVTAFNRNSILWDLNYFKYYFVKPHELTFREDKLEIDFQSFADKLLETRGDYFMYRDFQSRNILLHEGQPWYIDFQGGRKGPLMYDVASLLFQAKAKLGEEQRKMLLEYYLSELESLLPGENKNFSIYFIYFVYFRLIQVLGAYGFRGLIQRKGHFLSSIPLAIDNLKALLKDHNLDIQYHELGKILRQISTLDQYHSKKEKSQRLIVSINSFSYKKKGYPLDYTENGGGFAFDCRALPNPGRSVELRDYTGRDKPVIEFLESKAEVSDFFAKALSMASQSIDNYLDREFDHFQVNFGCTGGKHRSVYNAELMAKSLQIRYGDKIDIRLKHLQLDG